MILVRNKFSGRLLSGSHVQFTKLKVKLNISWEVSGPKLPLRESFRCGSTMEPIVFCWCFNFVSKILSLSFWDFWFLPRKQYIKKRNCRNVDQNAKFNCLTVCSYHVTYVFWSASTLYSCLNVKELLARNRRDIWTLRDYNGIRILFWARSFVTFRQL